jgi:hypothetical protein
MKSLRSKAAKIEGMLSSICRFVGGTWSWVTEIPTLKHAFSTTTTITTITKYARNTPNRNGLTP